MTRRAEPGQHALPRPAIRQHRLLPAHQVVQAAGQAAGGGEVLARRRELPGAAGVLPVAGAEAADRVEPGLRHAEADAERFGDAVAHQTGEAEAPAQQRRVDQPVAGVGVGDLVPGREVQPGQAIQEVEALLPPHRSALRHAEQRQRLAQVRQAAGHVEGAADRDRGQVAAQPRQQPAERIVQADAVLAQRQRREDMLGDRGVAHHGVAGEGVAAGQAVDPAAGLGPHLAGVEHGDAAARLARSPGRGDPGRRLRRRRPAQLPHHRLPSVSPGSHPVIGRITGFGFRHRRSIPTLAGESRGKGTDVPDADREALYRKVSLRLIPFMILLYLVSFLDRVNVGFAALTMNADLGITPYVFGWGAGIFFFGYFLFEVPSNVILEKVGARLWICRIMLTWGLISAAMAFVQGIWGYTILRFLLGAAEAGFLPGMILYLTYWFPAARRARFVALFMAAVPLASAIGAPVSGLILDATHLWFGLKGWQWLFIIEGLPACLLGLLVLAWLPDGPAKAPWLDDRERAAIAADLARDRAAAPHPPLHDLWPALADPRVILLGLVYFGIVIGLYGIGLWLPQIVKGMGFSTLQTGWIIALPYLVSAGAMLAWGRHSDRTGERVLHVALPALVSAIGFAASIATSSNVLSLVLPRRRRGRHLRHARAVLDHAAGVPGRHRRGRRHRPDQLDRQSRRLRRALCRRLDQGLDRQLHRRHGPAGRQPGRRRRTRPGGRPVCPRRRGAVAAGLSRRLAISRPSLYSHRGDFKEPLFQAKMNAADHIDYLKTINQTFHEQIKSADQKAAYIFTFLIALVAWSPEMRAVFTWTRTVPFPSVQWGLCLALVVALAGGLVCVALVLLPRKRNGGVCLYWARLAPCRRASGARGPPHGAGLHRRGIHRQCPQPGGDLPGQVPLCRLRVPVPGRGHPLLRAADGDRLEILPVHDRQRVVAIAHAELLGPGQAAQRHLARRRLPRGGMRLLPAEAAPGRRGIRMLLLQRRTAVVAEAEEELRWRRISHIRDNISKSRDRQSQIHPAVMARDPNGGAWPSRHRRARMFGCGHPVLGSPPAPGDRHAKRDVRPSDSALRSGHDRTWPNSTQSGHRTGVISGADAKGRHFAGDSTTDHPR